MEGVPGGACIDLTIDLPFGKGFYLVGKYDNWFGNDNVYDNYMKRTYHRKVYCYSIDGLMKYRLLFKRTSFHIATGFGESVLHSNFSDEYSPKDYMLNFTAAIGVDYFIYKSLSLSSDISYYGMIHGLVEGGRSNKIFQFKVGLSWFYVQPIKK